METLIKEYSMLCSMRYCIAHFGRQLLKSKYKFQFPKSCDNMIIFL